MDRPDRWRAMADEAIRKANVNLESVPARPAKWKLCSGRAGAACCCTKQSATASKATSTARAVGLLRQDRPARRRQGVTMVDDGSIDNRRGSLSFDDEGTPTQRTVLIEDGILVGYMQDRLNARLMGMPPTGNGRRESYAHAADAAHDQHLHGKAAPRSRRKS
jgi:TldD protein